MTDKMRIRTLTPSISSQVLYPRSYLMLVIKPVTLALGFTSRALYCTILSDFLKSLHPNPDLQRSLHDSSAPTSFKC